MAQEFSARGWKVAGGARNHKKLDELSEEISTDHFFHSFDVTQPTQVKDFASLVKDALGIPDLLVNNAGLINQNAPLWEISPKEFKEVLEVNLGGFII